MMSRLRLKQWIVASTGYPTSSADEMKMPLHQQLFQLALFTAANQGFKAWKGTSRYIFEDSCNEFVVLTPEKKELIKLQVVDACFILQRFLLSHYRDATDDIDHILLRSWFIVQIAEDLLLLENQLLFLVLEELFNLTFSCHQRGSVLSLLELTFHFFSGHNELNLSPYDITIEHFTDMFRTFHLGPPSTRSDRKYEETIILKYSASKLCEAGVGFKKNETNKCLLDLEFSRPHLQIPILIVEDRTEILFRNMLALEHCHCCFNSDYVCMICDLINTGEDVDVLVPNGIIYNMLGDNNAVAKLFASLTENVWRGNLYADYNDICKRLNDFCEDPRNKTNATFRRHCCQTAWQTLWRDYCRTPWQTAASFAAILLLILTIIQTVCSILQVVSK